MASSGWFLFHRILAHHDPTAAQGAEGIRAWLGQAWVHQVSVILHATGALLLAGGLAAVLMMRSAPATEGWMSWGQSRNRVRMAVLGGWAFNGMGGLMRLYEPDHPGLTMFAEVTWVQVMTFKHVALVGAFVFSLLAVEMGPRLWTTNLRKHASIALVLVLVASLSGGVATGLMLPGMDRDAYGSESGDGGMGHLDGPVVTWRNATVDFAAASPLTPRSNSMDIDVPEHTTEIWATITWANENSRFQAQLVDPDGEVRAESGKVTATSAEVTADKDLTVGTWTVRITSELAANEAVQVATKITQGGEVIRVLEETVTISAPGFEINLYMDPGEYFNYSWSLASGDPAVIWDIHSHPDGEVVTHHEGRDTSAEGNFTAGPNEIYSIYWKPEAGQSLTLTYRVEGNFTVHSIYR